MPTRGVNCLFKIGGQYFLTVSETGSEKGEKSPKYLGNTFLQHPLPHPTIAMPLGLLENTSANFSLG